MLRPQEVTVRREPPRQARSTRIEIVGFLHAFVANNWKVALYVLLIVLCVLFAPEKPLKFIYTEF